jgi:NAD(P)H dehydrogenase (quinone)
MNSLKRSCLLLFSCIAINVQLLGFSTITIDKEQSITTTVLVVYYSVTGNTEKMAQAVAAGAQNISSVNTIIKTPDKVTEDDLKSADAIILGSPTYWGDMSAQMKSFIDDWWLKFNIPLVNKVGGAFSTGAGEYGGKEHVLYSFVIAMMNAGMIIVGPLEGSSFGTVGVAALDPVNEDALKAASDLGERAANIAMQLKKGK